MDTSRGTQQALLMRLVSPCRSHAEMDDSNRECVNMFLVVSSSAVASDVQNGQLAKRLATTSSAINPTTADFSANNIHAPESELARPQVLNLNSPTIGAWECQSALYYTKIVAKHCLQCSVPRRLHKRLTWQNLQSAPAAYSIMQFAIDDGNMLLDAALGRANQREQLLRRCFETTLSVRIQCDGCQLPACMHVPVP